MCALNPILYFQASEDFATDRVAAREPSPIDVTQIQDEPKLSQNLVEETAVCRRLSPRSLLTHFDTLFLRPPASLCYNAPIDVL